MGLHREVHSVQLRDIKREYRQRFVKPENGTLPSILLYRLYSFLCSRLGELGARAFQTPRRCITRQKRTLTHWQKERHAKDKWHCYELPFMGCFVYG